MLLQRAARVRAGSALRRLCATEASVREMNEEMAELFGTPMSIGGPSGAASPLPAAPSASSHAAAAAAAVPAVAAHPEAQAALHAKIAWAATELDLSDDVERCSALARLISDCAQAEAALRRAPS